MSIAKLYAKDELTISFELYPPKSAEGEVLLMDHVQQLQQFNPAFLTCTYGAGGSTREKTLDVCARMKQQFDRPVASHLTVVGSTIDQLRAYLEDARQRDIDYIVALRGDPPKGETEFRATAGGLNYANELVDLIRQEFPEFGVLVAGYPEKHQEAASFEIDIENLKRKVDAGADGVITQLFYSNDDYFRFEEVCRRAGLNLPIVPGIFPVTNLAQIRRLSNMCGATLPTTLVQELEKHDDRDWQFQVGVDYAIRQVQQLIDHGVIGLHFYVLNKSPATASVLHAVELPHAKSPARTADSA